MSPHYIGGNRSLRLGSYSGFLSMVLRINHPETFYVAISATGSARAFLPFTESNTDRFSRYTLVRRIHRPPSIAIRAHRDEGVELQKAFFDGECLVGA